MLDSEKSYGYIVILFELFDKWGDEPHLVVWWRTMKIQIAGLSEGIHNFRFREPVAEVGLGEEFHGDVEVDVMLEKSGKQLYVKAGVQTRGEFSCDRCTAPFPLPLNADFQMYYVWDPRGAELLDHAEAQVIPPGLPVIDLADDIRQTVLLSVPLKLLCKADCKGLCPRCGADLNTETCTCPPETMDARWETLRGLRADEN
jgi:uncharacterized protein